MNSFKFTAVWFLLCSTIYAQDDLFFKSIMKFYWKVGSQAKVEIPLSVHGCVNRKHAWLTASAYYQKYQDKDSIIKIFSDTLSQLTFDGPDSTSFNTYYFNRSSEKVVIIVPPYGAQLADLIRFAGIFYDTDVVIVDYYKTPDYGFAGKAYAFATALSNKERKNRVEQLKQVFEYVQKQNYQEIIGSAQCYGSWALLELQASLEQSNNGCFDKLIIDSCPAGVFELRKKWAQDPIAVATVGNKMSPLWLSLAVNLFYYPLLASTSFLYQNFFIEEFLEKITVPIMFIHNDQDLLISHDEFNGMYQAVKHNRKCALIAPFKHLHASLKAKELYAHIVDQFTQNILL